MWLEPGQCNRYSDSLWAVWPGDFLFPGVKQRGNGVDHPPSSSPEVKKRVELYLVFPPAPLWLVLGWTLPSFISDFGILDLNIDLLQIHIKSHADITAFVKHFSLYFLSFSFYFLFFPSHPHWEPVFPLKSIYFVHFSCLRKPIIMEAFCRTSVFS